MIAQRTIEAVRAQVSVRDTIKEFAEVRRAGNQYTCCCPIHEEKTASLRITEERGVWHCFGCGEGGDAITFIRLKLGYSFADAVRYLAQRNNIYVEEEKQELTPEEAEKAQLREEMFDAYQKVQKHFVANLYSATKDAVYALNYAKNRWPEEFISMFGLGYSFNSFSELITFAQKEQIPIKLLVEMGLVKVKEDGRSFDFFRGRLMIPIRDLYGRVHAYTARQLNDGKCKYLNTNTNLLYQKDKSVFGIDVAASQAAKEDKFYLVEGAPDVLRLQSLRIFNAVASLGSDWTDSQFKVLKRYTRNICFIPDTDTHKVGSYGTGIKKVMKSGRRALQLGFRVFVREIISNDNTKQDPDSYYKSTTQFKEQAEEDFIIWYAEKRKLDMGDSEVGIELFDDVADLVALREEEHERNLYVDLLNKVVSGRSTWNKAIRRASQRITEEQLRKQGQSNQDLLENYGFQQSGNHYVSMGTDNKMVEWSNFILRPLFHIRDSQSAVRIFEIINDAGRHEVIELKQEDLTSLQKFCQRIEGLGNYLWKASSARLMQLKAYLYEKTETATRIDQLGWQGAGFFAFGNGVYYDRTWYPVDQYGIVRLPEIGNQYLPAFSSIYKKDPKVFQFERSFIYRELLTTMTLKEYVSQLIAVFGNNAMVAFSYLLATVFRDVVVMQTKSFPILNVFGPKGSGKSELGHCLMAFFVKDNVPPNIINSTISALSDTVAQCSNALVHIDEFKNSVDIEKREFLKGLWDGAGRNRMNMDKDKKREQTRVDSGIIVTGQEMASADIALFSRFIFLTFNKSTFSEQSKREFMRLVDMRKKGCTKFTLEILDHRPQFEHRFRDDYNCAFDDLYSALENAGIEDRILRNWTVPLAAFRALQSLLDMPFTYAELLQVTIDGVKYQNAQLKKTDELATFWKIMTFLQDEGTLVCDVDYRVDFETSMKTRDKGELHFSKAVRVLSIKQQKALQLYTIQGHRTGETLLPQTSLEYYLENSPAFLCKKVVSYQVPKDVTANNGDPTRTKLSYCFDYDKLVEAYDLSLISDGGEM